MSTHGRLADQTIVVTGSASGIGAAISRGMAREGANLVIADLNEEAAIQTAHQIEAEGGTALGVRIDVTDREAVKSAIAQAVDKFGRIDAYFNNAGMNAPMKFLEVTEENLDAIFRVNTYGAMIGTQEAALQFIRQGTGGKIINTASIAGRTGFPSFAPYSAAKAAVISFTQSGARALAKHNITVNAFAPGVVDTPLWVKLDAELEAMGEGDSGFSSMSKDIILGRPADPEDIVPTALSDIDNICHKTRVA